MRPQHLLVRYNEIDGFYERGDCAKMRCVAQTIFALESLPPRPARAIYLAGPVPRDPAEGGWHGEAVEELRACGYEGAIVVPRLRADRGSDADAQTTWEHSAMKRADSLLFWIPRALWTLPGLTTNLEWGIWHDSGKAVLGAPPDAPKMRYLRFYADLAGAPQANTISEAARLAAAIAMR